MDRCSGGVTSLTHIVPILALVYLAPGHHVETYWTLQDTIHLVTTTTTTYTSLYVTEVNCGGDDDYNDGHDGHIVIVEVLLIPESFCIRGILQSLQYSIILVDKSQYPENQLSSFCLR